MGRFRDLSRSVRQAAGGERGAAQRKQRPAKQPRKASAAKAEAQEAAAKPTVVAPIVVAGHSSVSSRDDEDVPHGLRMAAAWAWRILVLALAAAVAFWVIGRLKTVLIPVSIALLLTALLSPMAHGLRRWIRLPRSLSAAVVLIGGLAAVVGTLTLVVTQFVDGFPNLTDKASVGLNRIQDWLKQGPAHLTGQQLDGTLSAAQRWLQDNRGTLTSSAFNTAAATVEVLASTFLVLFATFFFLRDGARIWNFLLRFFPAEARQPLAVAGSAAWTTLVAYVRATVLVAFIDALGIGLALVVLRVDFAFPLAALVFLAAFVPIVGATVSGAVAVLVALVTQGPWAALAILIAVIVVQQVEGHVLQPLIMGRAVAVHPLAVILAIATGIVLGGIIGALVAVPVVAVLNTGVRRLAQYRAETRHVPAGPA